MNDFNVVFTSNNINFINISSYLIEDYLKMVNNPDVSKYISLKRRVFTYDDEINWIKDKFNNNSIVFSMFKKSTNEFIGNIELMKIKNGIGEIAICITSDKQGKYYGSESIKRFIKYCFEELKLVGIELSVYSHNERAINCYKRLGFVIYRVDKNVGTYDGLSIDDIYMRLENSNYYV